jgi:starvation-inducible outer membrane lipoprotein
MKGNARASLASLAALALFGAVDAQVEPARELEMLRTAEVAPLTPEEALGDDHIGKRVRWAGGVYHVNGTCLTILFARSGDHGEPRWTPEPTYQSFVACGAGVYDPELVEAHTNVTIIGEITGKQYIGMGGGGSDGPTIRIEKLFRWSDCLAGDDSPVCKQGFLTAEPIAVDQG